MDGNRNHRWFGRTAWAARVAVVSALALGVGLAPARADEVALRVWPNPEFGRLVFDWPAPVGHRAEVQGNRLILRFDRPVQTTLDRALQGLQRYVRSIQPADGDRTLIFELTQPSQVRSQANGNAVIVDIVPAQSSQTVRTGQTGQAAPTSQAAPTPQAAPTSAGQAAAGALPVRVGRHPGFTRLVFDWRQPVEFTVNQQGGEATISFNRAARIDTGTLAGDLPAELRPVRVEGDDRASAVTLSVPAGARLRNFRSGTGIVLDVLDGSDTAQAAPSTTAPSPQTAGPPPRVPPPGPPAAQTATTQGQRPPNLPGAVPRTGQQAQTPRPGQPGQAAPAGPAQTQAEAPAAQAPSAPAQPARPVFAQRQPAELLDGAPLPIDVASNADTVSIRFGFTQPTAAAVFRRGSNLWIAFDKPVRLGLDKLGGDDRRLLTEAEQLPVHNGTVMRANVLPGINPRIWRDGEAWVVDLRPQEIRPEVALAIEVQPVSPQGPRIFIPAESIGEPIRFADPEIGDEIVVVPLHMLGRGIDGERQYAQFAVLASEQGVAIRPNADDIEVRVLSDGIAVTSDRGLFISRAVQPAARPGEGLDGSGLAPRLIVGGRPAGQIFDMTEWRRGEGPDFLSAKQELQLRVAEATALSRSPPRLDLARFYFANGLAPEALGLLSTIEVEDPELSAKADTRAVRGAAKFMMRRFDEAREDLADPGLNNIKEVALWRGAVEAAMGRWNEASEHFARAGEVPDSYPRNYKTEIALLGAEAAIRVANPRGAAGYLDVVTNSDPSTADRARASFFRAKVLIAAGDVEPGVDVLRNLARGADRWSRVRSELAIIDVDLDRKRLSRTEAIERIEALRFTWRGDDIEFDTLYRLGQLYMQEGDFRQGLNAIRQGVTYYPNNQQSRQAARDLTDAFARLYIDGAADQMTPLGALALYEDFRELTPVGERGDEIIKRLADRLVAVDLLDRAANLLDRQIKFRLQGVEKARVGARLAVIRLLDRKPEAALAAIDNSDVPNAPNNVKLERGQLRARSLFELSRIDEAIKTLEPDNTREGDQLRAEILWRSQRWAPAARVFERLVGAEDPGTGPLDDAKSRLVLNLAVSLSLSSDVPKLAQLRQRYTAAMDKGAHRDAFRLITQRVGGEVSDFSTLVARFRDLDQLQSFMTKYREKLSTSQLSAIN